MLLNVVYGERVFSVSIEDSASPMGGLRTACQAETGVPAAEIALVRHDRALDVRKTLRESGLADGDLLHMRRIAMPDFARIRVPRSDGLRHDPKRVMDWLAHNPRTLSLLRQNNLRLADAYDSGDPAAFASVLAAQNRAQEARHEEHRQLTAAAESDPVNASVQAEVERQIAAGNLDRQLETATEHAPECAHGRVSMLYVECRVNGIAVKAMVDSGAQITIMSKAAAEKCNILRLSDDLFESAAVGVGGEARIEGKVVLTELTLAGAHLAASVSVMEDQPMELLLGLDLLRRHRCVIDLDRGVLRLGSGGGGSAGGDREAPFLSEADLPQGA